MVSFSSSWAALFDFQSCCGVHLTHIQLKIWASTLHIRGMGIPITLILSYIFVGIML